MCTDTDIQQYKNDYMYIIFKTAKTKRGVKDMNKKLIP